MPKLLIPVGTVGPAAATAMPPALNHVIVPSGVRTNPRPETSLPATTPLSLMDVAMVLAGSTVRTGLASVGRARPSGTSTTQRQPSLPAKFQKFPFAVI